VAPLAPWPAGDPNAVVVRILAQPAYRVSAEPDRNVLLEAVRRIWQWLTDMLHRFLPHVPAGAAKGAGTIVMWLLALVALAVLGFVAMRLAAAYASRERAARPRTQAAPIAARSASDLRAEAAARAERGDYAAAVVLLFIAAIVALDRRQVVAFDRARTAREYGRAVRAALGDGALPFDDLVRRFVLASYAGAPVGRDDYDAALVAVRALEPAPLAA